MLALSAFIDYSDIIWFNSWSWFWAQTSQHTDANVNSTSPVAPLNALGVIVSSFGGVPSGRTSNGWVGAVVYTVQQWRCLWMQSGTQKECVCVCVRVYVCAWKSQRKQKVAIFFPQQSMTVWWLVQSSTATQWNFCDSSAVIIHIKFESCS